MLKIQACVDDITFYLSSKESLDVVMNEIHEFGKYSGQKINQRKTKIIILMSGNV